MKLQSTTTLNIRSGPSTSSPIIKVIPSGTVVDTDDYQWKAVTLSDGTKGFCAANYLGPVTAPPVSPWSIPVPPNYFIVSQAYLTEDWSLYPKFGHHTGTDYGGKGQTNVPLFAVADGDIVYREVANSAWGASLGNHCALYVPSVDKSFLYCHLASTPPALGPVKSGAQLGTMGNTGQSSGGAIHLHLEGFYGKFQIAWRTFTSLGDIKQKTFDANAFIVSKLGV